MPAASINAKLNVIASYIYEIYLYQHTSTMTDEEDDDEYIPLEEALVNVLAEMRRPSGQVEQLSAADMEAALRNDIISGYVFSEIMQQASITHPVSLKRVKSVLKKETFKSKEAVECAICLDCHDKSVFVAFDCKHEFCKECVKQTLCVKTNCPNCRGNVKNLISKTREVYNEMSLLVR